MHFTNSTQSDIISEKISIDFENPEQIPLSIQLFDISGRLIRSIRKVTGSYYVLEKEGLPKGIYVILISGIKNLPKLIILN